MKDSIINQIIEVRDAGTDMKDIQRVTYELFTRGYREAFELVADHTEQYVELVRNDYRDEVPDELKAQIDEIEQEFPKAVTSVLETAEIAEKKGYLELRDFISQNERLFNAYINRERPFGFRHAYYVIGVDTSPRDFEAAKAAVDEFGLYETCHEALEKLFEVTGGDFSEYCVRGFRR
ncbi:MAG: DUF5049 domain-containing protein [Anaerovoracaceae bacterium]|jgi:hypothetical protein